MLLLATDFVRQFDGLSWSDVRWAYRRGIVAWNAPVSMAADRLTTDSSHDEIELANVGKNASWRVGELVEELAVKDIEATSQSCRRWLFMSLLWILEREADPLRAVEDLYPDFDYPTEVERFLRYMPAVRPGQVSARSVEENERAIMFQLRLHVSAMEGEVGLRRRRLAAERA